jgi:hypothetical protein
MRRCNWQGFLFGLLLPAWTLAPLSPSSASGATKGSSSLEEWAWYQELALPEVKQAAHYFFTVPPSVFDKALPSLDDLRLRDAEGKEIPYALRVRGGGVQQVVVPIRKQFNEVQGKAPSRPAEVSLELKGDDQPEHNEIEVATSGTNFRRRVVVEGSNSGKPDSWRPILDKALVYYEVEGKVVDVRKLNYPVKRYRFLKVEVFPDSGNPKDKPVIDKVTVRKSTRLTRKEVTLPAVVHPREAVPGEGGPGSAWLIDFDGLMVPCEQLSFDVAEEDFGRPYRLEVANPDEPFRVVARGDWRRRPGGTHKPLVIEFPEVFARRFRLVITDHANPPLTIQGVRYSAPAREVLFAASANSGKPLRLYFGNPRANSPHFDFSRNLPETIHPAPVEVSLDGNTRRNPEYHPAPPTLTEQFPWLIYVVLGLACLTLLGILLALARRAVAQHDATSPVSEGSGE